MGVLSYARGYAATANTAAITEVEVSTTTMGSQLAGGLSVIVSGSGRGDIKLYYVDFDETKVNDAFMTATKDSDLLILNYGGFIPKMIVSATPNAGTAMEWKIEVCGVN